MIINCQVPSQLARGCTCRYPEHWAALPEPLQTAAPEDCTHPCLGASVSKPFDAAGLPCCSSQLRAAGEQQVLEPCRGLRQQFTMPLGVIQLQMLPKVRQATSPALACDHKRSRTLSAQGLPKRMMHSPTVFPGEDAPGTGKNFWQDASGSFSRSA